VLRAAAFAGTAVGVTTAIGVGDVVVNFSGEVCSEGAAIVCAANRIGAKLNASATSAIADPLNLLINRVHLPSPHQLHCEKAWTVGQLLLRL
jgi:hypothetical protein